PVDHLAESEGHITDGVARVEYPSDRQQVPRIQAGTFRERNRTHSRPLFDNLDIRHCFDQFGDGGAAVFLDRGYQAKGHRRAWREMTAVERALGTNVCTREANACGTPESAKDHVALKAELDAGHLLGKPPDFTATEHRGLAGHGNLQDVRHRTAAMLHHQG